MDLNYLDISLYLLTHRSLSMAGSSLFILLLIVHFFHLTTAAIYEITKYGAKSDGRTDSAQSFLRAWEAACCSSGPSTVHVPPGTYLISKATFSGPCKSSRITLQIDGTLVSSMNYKGFGMKGDWIVFENVDGVSVYGGVIDGRGASLWSCKAKANNCPIGASVSYIFRILVTTTLASILTYIYLSCSCSP